MNDSHYERIRRQYPHPGPWTANLRHEYCVSGAACLYAGLGDRFVYYPTQRTLAAALARINPALKPSGRTAHRFARLIIHAEASGDWDEAWRRLRAALDYRRRTPGRRRRPAASASQRRPRPRQT